VSVVVYTRLAEDIFAARKNKKIIQIKKIEISRLFVSPDTGKNTEIELS